MTHKTHIETLTAWAESLGYRIETAQYRLLGPDDELVWATDRLSEIGACLRGIDTQRGRSRVQVAPEPPGCRPVDEEL